MSYGSLAIHAIRCAHRANLGAMIKHLIYEISSEKMISYIYTHRDRDLRQCILESLVTSDEIARLDALLKFMTKMPGEFVHINFDFLYEQATSPNCLKTLFRYGIQFIDEDVNNAVRNKDSSEMILTYYELGSTCRTAIQILLNRGDFLLVERIVKVMRKYGNDPWYGDGFEYFTVINSYQSIKSRVKHVSFLLKHDCPLPRDEGANRIITILLRLIDDNTDVVIKYSDIADNPKIRKILDRYIGDTLELRSCFRLIRDAYSESNLCSEEIYNKIFKNVCNKCILKYNSGCICLKENYTLLFDSYF